jgi:hypothetical protein
VRGFYDACMLSRHNWITEFIGYVLRRRLSDDPDRAFDKASDVYPALSDLPPMPRPTPFDADVQRTRADD